MDQEKVQKLLDDLQKFFSSFVLKLELKMNTLGVYINNEHNEEVMVVRYGNEEVIVDIDLVFKERTYVKVLGLEMESRHGFSVFMRLANKIMKDLGNLQAILEA